MTPISPPPAERSGSEKVRDLARSAAWKYARQTSGRRDMPNFLIIGTKRGGTTSLWNYLLAHPLMMPMFPFKNQKSAHYFDIHYDKGPEWYRAHFATRAQRDRLHKRYGARPVTGDASPLYLWDPRVAARAAHTIPDVKVIALLRNPVDRAYSHWKERSKEGVETLSFEEALEHEPRRMGQERARMLADPTYVSPPFDWYPYRERGEYKPQLDLWFNHFPREQVLVLRSEDMYADPQRVYDRVIGFLGLPAHTLTGYRRFNYMPSPEVNAGTRARLEAHYAPFNRELAASLGADFTWDASTFAHAGDSVG